MVGVGVVIGAVLTRPSGGGAPTLAGTLPDIDETGWQVGGIAVESSA